MFWLMVEDWVEVSSSNYYRFNLVTERMVRYATGGSLVFHSEVYTNYFSN
jgi:hypothetical protein